jgi:hypothetical protein
MRRCRAQEPPLQELAAGDRQPVQAPAAQQHAVRVRALRGDRDHAQAMAQRAPERQPDARAEHERERRDPQRGPPGARQRVADERRAGVDLVRERQEQRQVRVEVDRPPGLVGELRPREPVGGHAGGDQRDAPDGRREHARVRPQQLAELVQQAVARRVGIADGDERPVRDQQVQRPWTEPAVPAHEAVLADRALERSEARHQDDDHHHGVGRGEAGDPAGGGRHAARRAQRAERLGGDPERERDAEPEAGQRGEDIHHQRVPLRRQPAPEASHRPLGRLQPFPGRSLGLRLTPERRAHAATAGSGKPGVHSTESSAMIVIAS